jgi:SAM-dependent methyltransferase
VFKEVVERARRIRYGQIGAEDRYSDAVEGRHGIEVGGPSALFRRVLPLYRHVASLDGINFATDTMWEGVIADGQPFRYYRNRPGRQIIADATDLRVIPGGTYDFLLSSNCLEHIANPIKALLEWKRVVLTARRSMSARTDSNAHRWP